MQPGDVILTGTPPGVGVFRKPPLYMKVREETHVATTEQIVVGVCIDVYSFSI